MLLQTVVTLAAEAVEHEEPSKVPFYLAGGLLAVWAVVVSFAGLRAPASFPGSGGGRGGVMAVTVVLVAAAMATAVITG
ncbi:MAG TPA: hypothetical protein VN213_18945 [Solirubrobacteraceae bacterium]|nr:hypothetical protein [Solirubrobacteraceae bacterium]